jgi:oligopeptidase B
MRILNQMTAQLFWCAVLIAGGMNVMAQNSILKEPDGVKPPVAKKVERKTTVNGDTLVDYYYWLREKKNPEVIKYLEAENAYADAVMKPTEALQQKLYDEMLARIKETDTNVPYRLDNYFYYTRTEKGKSYPIFARKKGSLDAPEQVTIDVNELAQGHAFMSIGAYQPSPDNNLLAYSTDSTGFREYELHIKNLTTNEILPFKVERASSVAWSADGKYLFYVVDDKQTKRPYRLYRHAIADADNAKDALVYEEKDELYNLGVGRSRSRAYIFVVAEGHNSSEVKFFPANQPLAELKTIAPRRDGHEYYVDHHGDQFFIRTNQNGATNFKIVTAPVSNPREENWKDYVAHRKDVTIEDHDCFANFLVVSEREKGLQKLRVTDLRDSKSHDIEFPEPTYTASVGMNPEYNTNLLRFNYQSLVTPASVFDYDMATRRRELKKQQPVLGGYDPSQYKSERIWATARDGTRVPISLVYKKELVRDGKRPMLLYAYGSYGFSTPPSFSSNRLSLLNRGVIFAIAHIRGGSDMGREWYLHGKLMEKKNTFTDFIDSAEHLIKEKYTSSDRLVIEGGSAGGLLMGAVTNMRPDLFKAVIAHVPFVDVMNTMLDPTLPLTTQEYKEWGNPNEREAYFYMKSYSPYDNIEAKNYPTILVKTSLNDSQVMYWEPAKYVAKLRATKTDNNLLLFKVNLKDAGHGGASGRYDQLREIAFDYAFILSQFGITD